MSGPHIFSVVVVTTMGTLSASNDRIDPIGCEAEWAKDDTRPLRICSSFGPI